MKAAALLFSVPLAALLWSPRLPPLDGWLVPRTWAQPWLCAFGFWAHGRPGRFVLPALAWAALLLLAAAALRRGWKAWKSRSGGRDPIRVGWALGGLALTFAAARMGLASAVDLLQNAWFPPESMRALEPLLTWTAAAWALAAGAHSAQALIDRLFVAGPPRWAPLAWVVGPALALRGLAVLHGAGLGSLDAAAGLPPAVESPRRVILLAPEPQTHDETSGEYSAARLDAAGRFLASGRRSVFRRAASRFLVSGLAWAHDAEGYRIALERGAASGDPLARLLLLESLACAPSTEANRKRLDGLADERRFSAGSQAAARLASLYRRFGDAGEAKRWRERASSLPAGLIAAEAPAVNGVVEGALPGLAGATLSLHCRPDEYSPYALRGAQLSDSVVLDAAGRFRFAGLPAGSYYLALATASPRQPKALQGRRGDLIIGPGKTRAEIRLQPAF